MGVLRDGLDYTSRQIASSIFQIGFKLLWVGEGLKKRFLCRKRGEEGEGLWDLGKFGAAFSFLFLLDI
jgi:hypothetical protein